MSLACMGNHDFDFGIENLESITEECNFPWLISNAIYIPTGRPLAEGSVYKVLEVDGRRIGIIGLVEQEWMATLATIEENEVEYEDFVTCGRRLAEHLRSEERCDAVIALTHMRAPNDERLANEAGDVIDLILGGHDHHYDVKSVGKHGVYVCKSGTDFRDLTEITMMFDEKSKRGIVQDTTHFVMDSTVIEDPETKDIVDSFLGLLGSEMEKVIGYSKIALEGRFTKVRTQETNLGNFISDIMRRATSADLAIISGGTLRADSVIPAGDIRMKDLVTILPMVDELAVIEISGKQLLAALENGVSQWPRLEGRFPHLSGGKFTFDGSKEAGSRITKGSLFIGGIALDEDKLYSLCTKAYMIAGKDGYDVFKECNVLLDGEEAPVLCALVRNTFTELETVNGRYGKERRRAVLKGGGKWRRRTFHITRAKGRDSVTVLPCDAMEDDNNKRVLEAVADEEKKMKEIIEESYDEAKREVLDADDEETKETETTEWEYAIHPVLQGRITNLAADEESDHE
jgi:5'-nucleotidase